MTIFRRIWGWGHGLPPHAELKNYARVLIGDKDGRIIGEIEPDIRSVAWRLNQPSSTTIGLARVDDKATRDYLQYGNRILVQFDNGMPDWGGVLDPPRSWKSNGIIESTAYSAEYILGWRQTEQEAIYADKFAGTIYKELIQNANSLSPTGIEIGDIWEGGITLSPEYHYTNVLDIIRNQLVEHEYTTYDYEVEAREVSGYIKFLAHFYETRGIDRSSSIIFLEGHNVADVSLVEQGPIINSWDIPGTGNTWDEDRIVSHREDVTSIGNYDLRQGSEIYQEVLEQSTLDNIAESKLNGNQSPGTKDPRNKLSLKAVDLAPAAFGSYHVGDTARTILQNFGFGGFDESVRILTIEYDIKGGFCSLILEEVMV